MLADPRHPVSYQSCYFTWLVGDLTCFKSTNDP